MSYTSVNFKTKKQLKEAIAAGKKVTVFETMFPKDHRSTTVSIEGPHYPAPHTWWSRAVIDADGFIIKVS